MDHDHLLRSNIERVFSERDPQTRALAIAELYVAEPVMYEPDAVIQGRAAISAVVDGLLKRFGPDFAFVAEGPAQGHHGMALMHWHAGPVGGPVVVTGADLAEIVDGRISRLWVLLNAPAA